MSSPTPSDLIGKTLGPYRIVREIGRGGMAIVYEAHQPLLARSVAIKMLLPHFSADPVFVQRFLREARAAAGLSHPNIVTIYDVVEHAGQYFIVMQLAPGMALDALLRQTGRLPLPRAQHILAQVAAALDHAHARGLVHRDIKPANIIIGPDDHAILTDFGLAKAAERDASLTALGVTVGTPEYMSPEQARGQTAGPASDIYSLGIVLYEMLAGQRPFVAADMLALLHMQVYEPPPPIRSRAPDLPPRVETVIQQALAKQPERRHRSAGELAAVFSTIPTPRPVFSPTPRSSTPPANLPTPVETRLIPAASRQHKLPIGPIIAGVAALVIVGGVGAFGGGLLGATVPGRVERPGPAIVTLTVPTVTPIAAVAGQAIAPAWPTAVNPTAQPVVPTAAAGQPTSTLQPTATPAPSATTGPPPKPAAAGQPTSTLQPTTTPAPSATPKPATGGTKTAPPGPAKVAAPILLEPPANETVKGRITVKWQAVDLPPDAAYNVVWWRPEADPNTAQAFGNPTTATTQEINTTALGLAHGQTFIWAVVVVKLNSNTLLVPPAEADRRPLVFKCSDKCDRCTTIDQATGEPKTEPCNCQLICD